MNRSELLAIFFEDANRYLGRAVELSELPEPLGAEQFNELFRALHSVKGMAAALGMNEISRTLHSSEELIDQVRRQPSAAPVEWRAQLVPRLHSLLAELSALENEPRLQGVAADPSPLSVALPSSRIETRELDQLLEITQRLSTAHQRLEHAMPPADDAPLLAARDALEEAVRTLRREVLRLRLAPVQWLTPLLENAVLRWAEQLGLKVRLEVRGDQAQVDRLILQALPDPLGHLLRNSLIHGIEGPAERLRAGKPEEGVISITVKRRGERLSIELSDDGRGIAAQSVLDRAGQRGLAQQIEQEPLMLLTHANMSGRAHADLLSGRGMGLGAVRHAVERLGGSLTLSAVAGHRFSATLDLPTRVAILPLFLVMAGGQLFAIPVATVREVRATPKFGRNQERIGDLPALPLARALGMHESLSIHPGSAALVVGEGSQRMMFVVDRVLGRRELVFRPLGPPLEAMPHLSGAVVLAEGGVAPVIDLAPLIRSRAPRQGTISV